MNITLVLEPFTDANLKLAAQIGVDGITARYPGPGRDRLADLQNQTERHGLPLRVVEGRIPWHRIVLDEPDADTCTDQIAQLIRDMGELNIPVLSYHFMSAGNMTRTSMRKPARGGAFVSEIDVSRLDTATASMADAQTLWARLRRFLQRVLPVAERAGVTLTMHPDDPPVSALGGIAQIMSSPDDFQRLIDLVPSSANRICFCAGCFAEMGVNVPAAIRRLGPSIGYAHFRNVIGCVPRFEETFPDCGDTDMPAVIRALRDVGFDGPIRPDHVPRLEGETGDATGYTILGRLFAVGYMRGLMHAVDHKPAEQL